MIADIHITEKSFGDKILMKNIKFAIDDNQKIGVVGRNGVGKSTLFHILTGEDTDFSGDIIFRRGVTVANTAQEHHNIGQKTVLEYVLAGLPEYGKLKKIIDTYPLEMGNDMNKIAEYTEALTRFDDKGFYQIEEKIARELENFQLQGFSDHQLNSLSGGQKRLIEIIKIMHSDVHLALIDEPTNHMDYVAKQQFINWMKAQTNQAMLIITHDRDVLKEVDRIIELKDGECVSYKGNYDAYLKQNAVSTTSGMNDFEHIEKRIVNLKQKIIDHQRLKEKARNPSTIQKFKRLEMESRKELAELEQKERPSFWIDKNSIASLDYKASAKYDKFKAQNIKMQIKNNDSRSKHVLIKCSDLAIGYGENILFSGINIDLREGERVELRGRNGAGKTTFIKALLATNNLQKSTNDITIFSGEIALDKNVRIGIYEQEIDEKYLDDNLEVAIEKLYLSMNLPISDTIIRRLLADYLFTDADRKTPLAHLSGGQKARFQLIAMLANNPQLLILDEPTNHLDLPSIEEIETALLKYQGAILYISHDNYFRQQLQGEIIQIGSEK